MTKSEKITGEMRSFFNNAFSELNIQGNADEGRLFIVGYVVMGFWETDRFDYDVEL